MKMGKQPGRGPTMTTKTESTKQFTLGSEILWVAGLTILLTPVAWVLPRWLGFDDQRGYGLLAVWYCAGVTLGCLPWKSRVLSRRLPIVSVLIPMTWRITALAGITLWASATKWPNLNLFSLQLVGYYFPYLALESWLAIRKLLPARS
jgi:hypothetical protein